MSASTLNYVAPKDLRYVRLRIVYPNASVDWMARIPEFEVWGVPSTGITRKIGGWQTETSFIDLTAETGIVYTYSVNARNESGESGSGLGDLGSAASMTAIEVGPAGLSAEGASVYVEGVVSAVLGDRFYLQQADRSAGLCILWTGRVTEGQTVRVYGQISTSAGERRVSALYVTHSP